jgi:hypothetical protein
MGGLSPKSPQVITESSVFFLCCFIGAFIICATIEESIVAVRRRIEDYLYRIRGSLENVRYKTPRYSLERKLLAMLVQGIL